MANEMVTAQYRLVKKRVVAYLNGEGAPNQPRGREHLATKINASNAVVKLADEDPQFEDINLTARVFDTWISGDTSRGERRYTNPSRKNLMAIARFLISERYLTEKEFEAAEGSETPAVFLAEFHSTTDDLHRVGSEAIEPHFAIVEAGDIFEIQKLKFEPITTNGAYTVTEVRRRIEYSLGESEEKLLSRIAAAVKAKDETRAYRSKSEWVGFAVLTDTALLFALRPPLPKPFQTSCQYYTVEYGQNGDTIDRFEVLSSGAQKSTSNELKVYKLIQHDRTKFFNIHKYYDRIMEDYEELVSRRSPNDKFMFYDSEKQTDVNREEELMTKDDNIREIDLDLIHSCKDGALEDVRRLLNAGADPNCVEPESGLRPIQIAAAMGAFQVLEELLGVKDLYILVTTKDGDLPSQLISHEELLPSELETINKLQTHEKQESERRGVMYEDLLTRTAIVPNPALG